VLWARRTLLVDEFDVEVWRAVPSLVAKRGLACSILLFMSSRYAFDFSYVVALMFSSAGVLVSSAFTYPSITFLLSFTYSSFGLSCFCKNVSILVSVVNKGALIVAEMFSSLTNVFDFPLRDLINPS
jgi:hypothetical protein